jgi:hypothetical protein
VHVSLLGLALRAARLHDTGAYVRRLLGRLDAAALQEPATADLLWESLLSEETSAQRMIEMHRQLADGGVRPHSDPERFWSAAVYAASLPRRPGHPESVARPFVRHLAAASH